MANKRGATGVAPAKLAVLVVVVAVVVMVVVVTTVVVTLSKTDIDAQPAHKSLLTAVSSNAAVSLPQLRLLLT